MKISNKFGTENWILGSDVLSEDSLEILFVKFFPASHIEISYANKYKLK